MKLKNRHIRLFEDFINDIENSGNEDNKMRRKEKTDLKKDEDRAIEKDEEIGEEDLVAEIKKYFKKNK